MGFEGKRRGLVEMVFWENVWPLFFEGKIAILGSNAVPSGKTSRVGRRNEFLAALGGEGVGWPWQCLHFARQLSLAFRGKQIRSSRSAKLATTPLL